ncbi:TetR/AcrR family transcriptional regulator [Phytomonospora endophytica]|uniref:AcrR family transcriptional regulator n=1 Tax=Phytomonospora endophytica TaxID=714109 RepID=A0A841FLJ0_9ACTN|nr:TetR/AcrR family transcriptional regulator [Phytomonospora endophytica]MBB6033479.1 AcrR family transcriptional regulator [Phytomonospora endophytica]GIG65002.1 TetR family transcriptional regulator [Phytomonospora endophytica]
MGNREALLAGARKCLLDKGYARTTARDIAGAAGVSLAAIGYHFKSTQALLDEALAETMAEWGEHLEEALSVELEPGTGPYERFAAVWTKVLASFEADRPLWATQLELLGRIAVSGELQQRFAGSIRGARMGMAPMALGDTDGVGDRERWLAGSFYQALLTGVLAQYLMDPEHALSGPDLAEALRLVAEGGAGEKRDGRGEDPA